MNTSDDGKLRSRIVGQGEVPPDQLLANPLNWRRHPKQQVDALEGLLKEVGWVQRVIVNRRTGHVVDGHARVELALRRSEETLPVLYVDLSEAEERLVLAAIDPIGGLATTDQDKLAELLADVSTEDAGVQSLLDNLQAKASADAFNADEEWSGMPEYENENQLAQRQIIVSFINDEDAKAFARLIGQNITGKTKSVWYPAQEREVVADKQFV